MRRIILGMQVTLDGYIAGPEGDMSWVDTGAEAWEHNFESFNTSDAVIMGRVLYEGFLQYWPAAGASPKSNKYEKEYSEWIAQAHKYVFSNSLKSADWENSTLVPGDPVTEVARIRQSQGGAILVAGGARLAATFAGLGLIDEFRILIVPKVIGGGTGFLKGIRDSIDLKLCESRMFKSGTIAAHYIKA